jgi:putative ATP-binding cassette transporter
MTGRNGTDGYQRLLLARFWKSARGFWSGRSAARVWLLCAALIGILLGQLAAEYLLNYWNRDFFNSLERKDAAALGHTIVMFFPLAALAVALAIMSVWARMTLQRRWRRYLTRHLITLWLSHGRFHSIGHLNGTDTPRNAEHRIAEDARVATDAPVDLVLALISSILTVMIFSEVLATVGGAMTVQISYLSVTIPAYLALAVVAYTALVTVAALLAGHRLTSVVQEQVQAEAAFRSAANLIRESGDGLLVGGTEVQQRRGIWLGLRNVIEQWRRLCWQLMRITLVTHGNMLLAPVVGLLLCAPKYLDGQMSLGEVTQAAAAFVTVQGAANWFVNNFQRMADWRSAANRVAALLLALDELKKTEVPSAARVNLLQPGEPPSQGAPEYA